MLIVMSCLSVKFENKSERNKKMDAYQKFKNEITDILNDIDTLMWSIDSRNSPNKTLKSVIEIYEDTSERLKQAFDDLKTSEGDVLMKNITYEGRLRN